MASTALRLLLALLGSTVWVRGLKSGKQSKDGSTARMLQSRGNPQTDMNFNANLDRQTSGGLSSLSRANLLLQKMTSLEKVDMLHGVCMSCPYVGLIKGNARLGIPPLNQHDGPQGFRNEPFAKSTTTSWPGAMAMAATWDEEAVYQWGSAQGKEFRDKGANVQLGPGLNLARVPVNGRNFEYLAGEDPYLGYKLSKPAVRGIQEHKVIACGKHWVGNSQEANRMDVSEDVDERTLFEMYYPPFEGAIEAGLGSIMCSYNRLNGTHSCENTVTLGHLKNDLGFQGFVMSDWGATHSASLRQGLDMEMPTGEKTSPIALLLNKSPIEDVDNAVRRTLRMMYEVGVMDEQLSTWDGKKFFVNVSSLEHIQLARRLSADATVLLKNEGQVLPLPRTGKIAVIGFAGENGRALAYGHGSGEVNPSYYVSPLEGLAAALGSDQQILFSSGTDMADAIAKAKAADHAIVFVGGSASEGSDRPNLSLDGACRTRAIDGKPIICEGNDAGQNAMVAAVAQANPKTVVVASVPGAFLMPWVDSVPAVLVNWMPGQQAGHAISDLIFGDVNPSAKLPITLPNVENEIKFSECQYPGVLRKDNLHHSVYSEQLLVGYRYYDANDIAFTKGFPFGHGLSYTSFTYTGLAVTGRKVSFTITNAGQVPGREVAQLYLSFPKHAGEPPLQLKGFTKTELLAPGKSQRVELELAPRDTSIWDSEHHRWAPVSGSFGINVGASSRDIRLNGRLQL